MLRISSVGRPCARSIRKRSASMRPKRNGGVWKRRSTPFGVSQIPALLHPRRRPHPTLPRKRGRVGWGHPRQRQQASIGAPASDLPDRPDLTDSTRPPLFWDRGRLARSFFFFFFFFAKPLRGGRDARGPRIGGARGIPTPPPAHSFWNGSYDNRTIMRVTRVALQQRARSVTLQPV